MIFIIAIVLGGLGVVCDVWKYRLYNCFTRIWYFYDIYNARI